MDELDFLLEELSRVSSQEADAVLQPSVGESEKGKSASKPGQITPVYTSRLPATPVEDSPTHVYSQIQEPEEATVLSPHSATTELDSIMQELLGLSASSTASVPSPLILKSGQDVEKQDRKNMEEGQENGGKGSVSGAGDKATDEVGKASRAGASIDDLLGNLTSDMKKMGVQTSAKGHCVSCGKCIVGKFITALGEVWHPEHFVCVICGVELGTVGFFEKEGKAYCQKDYENLCAPRCAYCKAPILQNILTAMNQSWHPEHFFCVECGELFGSKGYMEREGKPYCCKDFYKLFAPKCSGCGEPVKENYLSAANGTWHPQCFVCADCLNPFLDGCFLELDGRPLCTLHYHSRQGTLCGGCGTPISGRCISALDRKFHPEHFVCAFCLRQLTQGVFKEQGGKPYCATCHSKLFL